jgi:hypothetical protein
MPCYRRRFTLSVPPFLGDDLASCSVRGIGRKRSSARMTEAQKHTQPRVEPLLLVAGGLVAGLILSKHRSNGTIADERQTDRGLAGVAVQSLTPAAAGQSPMAIHQAHFAKPNGALRDTSLPGGETAGLAARFAHWLALYGAYLFVAGWTYLDHYFRVFGISPRWLELGVDDTVARGFAVLFGAGEALTWIYLTALAIAILIEYFFPARSRSINTAAAIALVLLFVPTYLVSRRAGISAANIDRSDKTTLPTVTFAQQSCSYMGKLVYLRNDTLFVSTLQQTGPASTGPCPIDRPADAGGVPQLWLLRSTDLQDVRVIHYDREAK